MSRPPGETACLVFQAASRLACWERTRAADLGEDAVKAGRAAGGGLRGDALAIARAWAITKDSGASPMGEGAGRDDRAAGDPADLAVVRPADAGPVEAVRGREDCCSDTTTPVPRWLGWASVRSRAEPMPLCIGAPVSLVPPRLAADGRLPPPRPPPTLTSGAGARGDRNEALSMAPRGRGGACRGGRNWLAPETGAAAPCRAGFRATERLPALAAGCVVRGRSGWTGETATPADCEVDRRAWLLPGRRPLAERDLSGTVGSALAYVEAA